MSISGDLQVFVFFDNTLQTSSHEIGTSSSLKMKLWSQFTSVLLFSTSSLQTNRQNYYCVRPVSMASFHFLCHEEGGIIIILLGNIVPRHLQFIFFCKLDQLIHWIISNAFFWATLYIKRNEVISTHCIRYVY